ncbi:hypothetical protein JRY29_13540 [Salmonella enterica subsp. enterica serovar Kentucky]|nr:hypothetical protein JRY29_13540 [Salmonella enterica subsp. enterica serovar Kentucky]
MILRTEQEALAFMQNYHPSLRSFQNVDLQRIRQAVREAEPKSIMTLPAGAIVR